MARPRSDERESAIIDAATRIFAAEGLAAATATIAKEAGVSNGSLFTYFATKADLLNRLYVDFKAEMAAATAGIPPGTDKKTQLNHVWRQWLEWAAAYPHKRKVLALLSISDEITVASRRAGELSMADVVELLERCRQDGALRAAPMALTAAIIMGMAEATMDFMARDPDNAELHGMFAFDALWRALN